MNSLKLNPNYLKFSREMEIPAVDKFNSKLFYESIKVNDPSGGIDSAKLKETKTPVMFYNTFTDKVVNSSFLPSEICLNQSIVLHSSVVVDWASDTEILTDFNSLPLIPVKIFTPIFKSLLETWADNKNSKEGLSTSGVNLFYLCSDENNSNDDIFPVQIWFQKDSQECVWWAFAPMLNYSQPEHNLDRLVYSL